MNELLDACAAAGFLNMGVAIGMLVAGLLVGYLIGARKAIFDWLRKLATAAAEDKAADKGADGGDGEDADQDDDEMGSMADDLIAGFLDSDWVTGHDDHPETEFNPIMMYQVKKAKDEMRARKAIEALLLANDLPLDHLESMTSAERAKVLAELKAESGAVKVTSNVGSVAGVTRKYGSTVNATHILVISGARLTAAGKAVKSDANADAKKGQEVRERLRVIDSHLSSTDGIDIGQAEGQKGLAKAMAGVGGLAKNALEKAQDTKLRPAYNMPSEERIVHSAKYAHLGRSRVGPPLDHAIAANNQRERRASCAAAARRVSAVAKRSSCEGASGAAEAQTEGQDEPRANVGDNMGAAFAASLLA